MIVLAVLNLLLLTEACLERRHGPEVRTSYGLVRGKNLLSRNEREYFSFSGIPYAQPPVGSLRLKPPEPPQPWRGVLDATKPMPLCAQPEVQKEGVNGQEDCLYLTVNSPNISNSLPVLVYTHGGAFVRGNSGPIEMGGYFMDEDVVLVALHYRVGLLGFLSMENEEIPGNYGLKDMEAALKWVKKEIHNFGGNPELISVFGISAGGASSHFMCSLPRTRKLLKGCISQSGTAGSSWSLRRKGEAKPNALKIAKKLGCSEKKLLPCLQAKPLKDLLIPIEGTELVYVPAIEPENEEAMITEWPPKDTNFPWITGHTSNEGIMASFSILKFQGESGLDPYLKDWENYFTQKFHLKHNAKEKAKRIHDRFFHNNDPYTEIEKLISESLFVYPSLKSSSIHTGPKFFYFFNYTGGPSMEKSFKTKHNFKGVAHGGDKPYFFQNFQEYRPQGWPSWKDVQFSEILIKFWVEFARTQNPNWSSKFSWNQFYNGQHLVLDNHRISMEEYEKKDEIIAFWDSIFA